MHGNWIPQLRAYLNSLAQKFNDSEKERLQTQKTEPRPRINNSRGSSVSIFSRRQIKRAIWRDIRKKMDDER